MGSPETLTERLSAGWLITKPMRNGFNPTELYSKSRFYAVHEEDGQRGLDLMHWNVAAGHAPCPILRS